MKRFAEPFGQVLSEWMEKNGYTATTLMKRMDEKSRTVIIRLMKDESGYKSCAAFWERFQKAFPELNEEDFSQFEKGVEVVRLGLERYQIHALFRSQLMDRPEPAQASELADRIADWAGDAECRILALGCFETETLFAFQELLERSEMKISIEQHVLEDCTPLLYFSFWDGIRLHFDPRYQLHLYKHGCSKEKTGVCAQNILLLCRQDGRQGLLRKNENVWQELEWSREPELMALYTSALTQTEPLRETFLTPFGSDDLAKFMLSCADKERNRVIYQLKEDIGVEYLPVDLLYTLLNDQAADVGLDWEKNGTKIRALFFSRFQNLYQKNQPTYLTVTRGGMERFMQMGRLSDHVACFRPFTPEERKWLIDFICGQAEKRPSFSIRFLKTERKLPMTLVGIEEEGLVVCPSDTRYRLAEHYREMFVADKTILEYYNSFYRDVLLPEWTESQEDTLKELRQMKNMI